MGPTVWITRFAGRFPPVVATASPAGRRWMRRITSRHSAMIAGPPARWIAPSTPPPPARWLLAALTIPSTASWVMSPRTRDTRQPFHSTSICRLQDAPQEVADAREVLLRHVFDHQRGHALRREQADV